MSSRPPVLRRSVHCMPLEPLKLVRQTNDGAAWALEGDSEILWVQRACHGAARLAAGLGELCEPGEVGESDLSVRSANS